MINSSGVPYNVGKNFRLMLLLPDEFHKRTDFDWTVFEMIISISAPNSFNNNLFSSRYFWKADVVCPIVFNKETFGKGIFM